MFDYECQGFGSGLILTWSWCNLLGQSGSKSIIFSGPEYFPSIRWNGIFSQYSVQPIFKSLEPHPFLHHCHESSTDLKMIDGHHYHTGSPSTNQDQSYMILAILDPLKFSKTPPRVEPDRMQVGVFFKRSERKEWQGSCRTGPSWSL